MATGTTTAKTILTAATVSATLASGGFTAGSGTNLNNYNLPTSASERVISAKALSILRTTRHVLWRYGASVYGHYTAGTLG